MGWGGVGWGGAGWGGVGGGRLQLPVARQLHHAEGAGLVAVGPRGHDAGELVDVAADVGRAPGLG